MGMFNVVNLDRKCTKCGADLEWQSKGLILDGLFLLDNTLTTYEVTKRLSGEIHTSCDVCHTWYDLYVKNGDIIEDSPEMQKMRMEAEQNGGRTVTVLKDGLEKLLKKSK